MKLIYSLICACLLAAGCATTGKSGAPEAPATEETAGTAIAESDADSEDALLDDLDAEFQGEGKDTKTMSDPLKPWNKAMFHFNDKLYLWVLRPAAIGYGKVVPRPARTGIDNFFANLSTPVPLGSCMLQGRWKDAGVVMGRFWLNTTAGGLGFYDFADRQCGMKKLDEDIDQAIGSWGVGTGCYVVWPLLGPSSVRGTVGMVGDRILTPTTWLPWPWEASLATGTVNIVNRTSLNPDFYKEMKGVAAEPYTGLREAYYQNRQKLVEE